MKVILVILTALVITGTAQAHRVSGHPKSLKGRLAQVELQIREDHAAIKAGHRVLSHTYWLRYDLHYRKVIKDAMYYASLPPHYNGWNCIHGGEGNGTSPNGYYHGPLQMTIPWMGYSYDWNSLPTITVFWIAERVSARQGFSYKWMKGQWPLTYPPCAGYF